jgi:rhamnose utilization protein RhaD (predicted bifunctional aldolase and dehydrogenase)
MSQDPTLTQLITLSNNLGNPINDYVILAEGNTSTKVDDETFWVKASGTELRTIDASGFVQLRFDKVLPLLEDHSIGDNEVKTLMDAAKVDPSVAMRPSVEAVLHALALQLPGITFIGHTHPTAINSLTCAKGFEEAISGRLFPDEIVLCGVAPVVIPYTDPGLPLARKVQERINQYLDEYGEVPRIILMQNHGLIALGKSAQQVENITLMAVKTARILLGTFALGGPNFLTPDNVDRIHTRPDELYRRIQLGE